MASHLQAGGHNASAVLGHSSSDVTREHYLDPKIVGMVSPSAVLFRPDGQHAKLEAPVPQLFCTRYASQVAAADLQAMMRQGDIKTTMDYYVDIDAEKLGDKLW